MSLGTGRESGRRTGRFNLVEALAALAGSAAILAASQRVSAATSGTIRVLVGVRWW
jgi:hypothetical protein